MFNIRPAVVGMAGLGLTGLLGCGGAAASGGRATMNVTLVDGPIAGYQEVNVHIQTVEIHGDRGWITLGTPNRTINLLNLVGGVEEALVAGATLPAGDYSQMRLVLGSGNTVKLSDGTVQPLTVPSGLTTGIKLVLNFNVATGTTKDVWIDFDAAHSIQVVRAGNSGQYLLRPTVWAYDKLVTGSIHGTLTDAATATGLSGALVYAETLDASGNARIARSTVTDASGAYTLNLLPVNATYYVVSQPLTGVTVPKAYDAKASDGFPLSTATPVFVYNTPFTATASTGGLTGALVPQATSTQSDRVNLVGPLTSPTSGSHAFILRTTMAAVDTATETYGFTSVPAGAYSLQAIRTTLNPDGSMTTTSSVPQAAAVVSGATATSNLSF